MLGFKRADWLPERDALNLPPIPISRHRLLPVKRSSLIWLTAITIVVTALVWLTFYEIKSIAEDNAPTQTETAECLANLDPNAQADPTEACPTDAEVIFAARHPTRNALVLGAIGFIVGYLTLAFHQSDRSQILGKVHVGR